MEKKLPYVFQKYKNYKEEIDSNVTRNKWKTLKQNYKNANNPFFLYRKTQETPGELLAQVNVYPEFDNLPELTRIKSKRNAASQADVYAKTQKQFENTYNNYIGSLVASGMTEEDADERFWSDYYPNSEMKKLNDEVEFQQRYILSGPHGEEPIETVSPFLSYIYPPTAIPKYIADETTGLVTGERNFGDYASNMAEMAALGFFGRIKGAGQAAKEAWKKSAPVKETPPPPKTEPKVDIPDIDYNLNQNFLLGSAEEAQKYANILNKKNRIPYGATRKRGNGKGSFWFGNISSDVYVPKDLLDPKQVVNGLTEKDFKIARKTQAFKNSIGTEVNPKDYYKVNLEKLLTAESPQFGSSKLYDQILAQIKQTKYGADVNKAGVNLYYNPNTVKLHQHMLPFAAGNIREGRPFVKQLGSVISSTPLAVGIPSWTIAKGVQIGVNQKQYHDWMNSANQLSNEGWLFQSNFNDHPDALNELNLILDSYKSDPTNETYKYYMENADRLYGKFQGYEEYKQDYLNNNGQSSTYAKGGKIHIKKENRGKFTAAANRAGKSVQAYASQILANKENYSPTLVKRANFARNASKWHAEGGELENFKKMSKAQQDFYLKMSKNFKTPVFSGNNNVNIVPYKDNATAYVSGKYQEPIWLQWQRATGLPWNEAKKRGFTDGSYQQNIALQNYLQDGQFSSIEDMRMEDYNKDYLFPVTAPTQYEALTAQREYLDKLKNNTVAIPYDPSHVITLTNAGNLTGATLPYDYIDTVYKNSQKYGYDPYIELGIIGRETRFGLDAPYTDKTKKALAYTTRNEDNEDYRGERTFTDMANNHVYWTFPLRSEINQIGRNNNLQEYIYDYGTPIPFDDMWWNKNYESDFNNARMKRLIADVKNYQLPNEHQSIINSYNSGLYSNMDAINQTIEYLKKSPEIQKRLRELSNSR